jgi:hypothetical protein
MACDELHIFPHSVVSTTLGSQSVLRMSDRHALVSE